MIKSFKIRIYPTKEQEQLMWEHVHAARWLYNFLLETQIRRYQNGGKHMTAFDMNRFVTSIKKQPEYAWLNGVDSNSLYRVCTDLANAYRDFFAKTKRFPRFKTKKHSKASFPVRDSAGCIWFSDRVVKFPTIGQMKYKTDFDIPQGRGMKFSNPRVTFVNGKWMLSIGMECENQVFQLTDKTMGVDLGVKNLAIVEFGGEQFTFHNINKSQKMRQLQEQLKHLRRSISRKYEANRIGNKYVKTNNIRREEDKLRKLYARIANIRNNYIHQTTHELVSKLPCRVVMEDLNVRGMMKNRHLSRAIGEQCFAEFLRQMRYKCEWRGIEFVQVPRFYPSSKTCSGCGCIKEDLKLSDRTYKCECCGLVIDRDYNAAINLSRYIV